MLLPFPYFDISTFLPNTVRPLRLNRAYGIALNIVGLSLFCHKNHWKTEDRSQKSEVRSQESGDSSKAAAFPSPWLAASFCGQPSKRNMLNALIVAPAAEFKVVSLFHALLQELHVFPNIAHE